MECTEYVRVCLAHFRSEGLTFAEAWARTLHSIPRGGTNLDVKRQREEWISILRWGRPAWQAHYEGRAIADVIAERRRRRSAEAAEPAPARVA